MVSSLDDTKLHKTSVPVSVPTPDPASISNPAPSPTTNAGTTPNISLLSAAAFQNAMHSKGAQCFSAFIWNPNEAAGRLPPSLTWKESPTSTIISPTSSPKEAPIPYLHIKNTT